jgi:hypothetical protein
MPNLPSAVRLRRNTDARVLLGLVIIEVLTNFLSDDLTVGRLTPSQQLIPHRQFYGLWLGFIGLGLLAAVMLWALNKARWLRVATFLLNSLFTAQLFAATVLIVVRLMQGAKVSVANLLVDGLVIFATNILVFSLWYWYIDSARTRFLETTIDERWDFLFPQRQASYPGYQDWQPQFGDYVFLAYTTSVAFTPTDTLPLSRAAKMLTVTQSVIALIAITAVVGTAINIMAGSV